MLAFGFIVDFWSFIVDFQSFIVGFLRFIVDSQGFIVGFSRFIVDSPILLKNRSRLINYFSFYRHESSVRQSLQGHTLLISSKLLQDYEFL